jgi:N-acyl-D-aspartate/D-glutamate deacylase
MIQEVNSLDAYDVIIEHGTIVDGSGSPGYAADLGIRDGKIAAIGALAGAAARRRIDASGHIVAPGFIDAHQHGEIGVLVRPDVDMSVRQGITSVLVGLCGVSAAPTIEPCMADHRFYQQELREAGLTWRSFGDYLAIVDHCPSVNVASMVGYDNLRISAMGFRAGAPTAAELEDIKAHAREAMDAGAIGISHGAGPASLWSSHDEVTAVVREIGPKQGLYISHIRAPQPDDIFSPYKEAISVGAEAGVAVQITHFKTHSAPLYGKAEAMLAIVDDARGRGLDITIASYPYTGGGGGLRVPSWAEDGGPSAILRRLRDPETRKRIVEELNYGRVWDTHIAAVRSPKNKWCEGRKIPDIAKEMGVSNGEVVCRLLEEEDMAVGAVHAHLGEEDLQRIMQYAYHMVGSDTQHFGDFRHPRCYGTYPRFLGHYVRELHLLSLEDCVRRMTSFPAQRLGLVDRGLLKEGMAADVTVFDAETIADRATFEAPQRYPSGIPWVLVNGEVVVEQGELTSSRPGRALRRGVAVS